MITETDARDLAVVIEGAVEDWRKEWVFEGNGIVVPLYSTTPRAVEDLALKIAQGIRRTWNLGEPKRD